MRAIVLVLGALALGPALAAGQKGVLADKCRTAFYEVIPFYRVELASELDPDAYLASRAAAHALCRKAADQGSESSSFFSAMLAAPAAEEYAHLEYSKHGHYPGSLFRLELGSRPDPQYAYEVLSAYRRIRAAYLQAMAAADTDNPEAQLWMADMHRGGVGLFLRSLVIAVPDEARVLKMYRRAAELGDLQAKAFLGNMLLNAERESNKYYGTEFPRHTDSDGNWAQDWERYAEPIALLTEAAERGEPDALLSLLFNVFNYANKDDGRRLGPRDLAAAEHYCEIAVRKGFETTPASMCSYYFGHAYAEKDNALGLDYAKSAYWLALFTNRLALEGHEAPSGISARLDLSLAELDEEERARVLEVARIERVPVCDDPYYGARFSSYARCAEHNALDKQQQ